MSPDPHREPCELPCLPPAVVEAMEGRESEDIQADVLAALGGEQRAGDTVTHLVMTPANVLRCTDRLADPAILDLVKLAAWGALLTGWQLAHGEVAEQNVARHRDQEPT